MSSPHLILASTSPRRKELLDLLGIPFEMIPPTVNEEVQDQELPFEHVRRLAFEKANSVAIRFLNHLVLGSDTIIEMNGHILGKPAGLEEACKMLNYLRGRCHYVHTGLALVGGINRRIEKKSVETVKVWFKNFSNALLETYLETKESLGKAGAYSIQGKGADLIEKIEGDYPAVVGLPLRQTAQLLEEAGVKLPTSVEDLYRRKPYRNWKIFQ
jgi:septum formation protein